MFKNFDSGKKSSRALNNQASDSSAKQTKNSAKSNSLKITIIYFLAGCAWILISDNAEAWMFNGHIGMLLLSISKGLLYVLFTSILIFSLVYSALKRALLAKDELNKANAELEKSNRLYKELNEELDKRQAFLKSLINSIPDLIFYKNTDLTYLGSNKAFQELVGKSELDIVGKTAVDLFDQELAEAGNLSDKRVILENAPHMHEQIFAYPNGQKAHFEILKSPYYDLNGNLIGLIGSSRDISERKAKEDKIKYLNYHDTLTGLYNRAFFQMERERMDSPEYLPLSVIIGDVNGLKLINDAFGHTQGDALLKLIADIFKENCRQQDVIFRTGGDEFSILLPNANAQVVKEISDKIRTVCDGKRLDDNIMHTDIALGYATKTNPDELFEKTLILAEDLMYRRKLLERQSLHSSILASIRTTMFEKSNETQEHAERLADLSKKLGTIIGLSEDQMNELELVAMLHDIGKISIDQNILTKAGQLSDDEWREIQKHPEVGYRIANSCQELRHIAEYILCHHERWDGSGYPQGLSGENIPLISRIISITDSYDAMTEDRSYRKALSHSQAVIEITRNAGTQFDPTLAKLFVEKVISNHSDFPA